MRLGKFSVLVLCSREGKPSEEAILASRVIDRTLRPLFDQSMRHAVQVIVTVISVDENDSDNFGGQCGFACLGSLQYSLGGPVGCVRIGKYDTNNEKLNPRAKLRIDEDSQYKFDLTVCGKDGNINMIEASAHQVNEDELEEALQKLVQK